MITEVTLFGAIEGVHPPSVSQGAFVFSIADIKLTGRSPVCVLSDVCLRQFEHSQLSHRHNAPWVRGRLEHTFGFVQPMTDRDIVSRIDDSVTTDRLMLNVEFVGQTTVDETQILLPFLCTEIYAEACVIHGQLPDRNTDKYTSLISSMIHSFVSLLISDERLSDFDDYGVVHGRRFAFGVRNGVAYNHFPGTPG